MLVFFKKKLDNFAFEADKYINKLLVTNIFVNWCRDNDLSSGEKFDIIWNPFNKLNSNKIHNNNYSRN